MYLHSDAASHEQGAMLVLLQVALVHYYGGSLGGGVLGARPYPGGPGGLIPRVYISPPPRLNLHSLLNRNVPSIAANYKAIYAVCPPLLSSLGLKVEKRRVGLWRKSTWKQRMRSWPGPMPTSRRSRWPAGRSPTAPTSRPTSVCLPPSASNDVEGKKAKVAEGATHADISHTGEEGNYTEDSILLANPEVEPGGTWRPLDCHPAHKVVIIIPYRYPLFCLCLPSSLVPVYQFLIPQKRILI